MTKPEERVLRARPVFTEGSTLRHVLVMTASGSAGIIALFVVDLLSLLYVSWLGDPAKTAGVGLATQVLFVAMSVNIGLSIGVTAVVARAIGAGRRVDARRLASSGLVHATVVGALVSIPIFVWRDAVLEAFGAAGEARAIADSFLAITAPANALMALGMALQGLLRALGDARRSMYVTLFGALATAALDPLLIFGLNLGPDGAAISTVVSRFVFCAVGFWAVVRVHQALRAPSATSVRADIAPVLAIAGPAILTNLATPIANSYAMRVFAGFGEPIVAAIAIVDRVTPVAFGVLFALTGAIGPILAQNYGARRLDRVLRTLSECFALSAGYVAFVWLLLWLLGPAIADLFHAVGRTRDMVLFYCNFGVMAWAFLAGLFVANTAFNNLGFAFLSTFFNWGRTLLGVIPFVTLGGRWYGPEGAFGGIVAGAALFGTAAAITSFIVVARLRVSAERGP